MRFPAACLSSAALALTATAYAQAPPAVPTAKISDIQVSREGDAVSILVKLTQQPSSASATSSGTALVLEIDGMQLAPLALTPPAGSLVTGVSAGSSKLILSGAALANATTVVYRNAVLIEARLADPADRQGASLLAAATAAPTSTPVPASAITAPAVPTAAQPVALAPAHAPPPLLPALPLRPPATSASAHPASPNAPATLTPAAPNAPIALVSPVSKPAQTANELETHAAERPATPKRRATAKIAGIDAMRCSAAAAELAKDPWALGAMGDQALCLLDAGKLDEAKNRLDQLAAITPRDWRVALGLAALHDQKGETELAKASWRTALERAPTDAIRAAIQARAQDGGADAAES